MVADIPRLTSVASLWADAFQRKAYELATDEYLETAIRLLDGRDPSSHGDTSPSFVFSEALQMQLMQARDSTRIKLFNVLHDTAHTIVDRSLASSLSVWELNADSVIVAAFGIGAKHATAPDHSVLQRLGQTVRDRFRTERKATVLHEAVEHRLLTGAHAALLAQDPDLLREITALREELQSAPRQWAMLRDIGMAGFVVNPGFLRCEDAGIRRRFLSLFQSQRTPFARRAAELRGEERLFLGPLRGAYFYAWIYLQSFAPEPTVATDWDVLRELLIG